MEFEAKIISKHNLDSSSLENLAKDIANRLECNIEYGQYQINNGKHEFIQFGDIVVNPNGITTTLYDMTNDDNSEFNYVVELGDEAKLIFNDIIELLPPWEEDYEQAFEKFKANGFKEQSYYTGVFEELKKLGADKVYFIKDNLEPEVTILGQSTLEKYLDTVKAKATFFEIQL